MLKTHFFNEFDFYSLNLPTGLNEALPNQEIQRKDKNEQDMVRKKRKLSLPFTDIITASKYTTSKEKAEVSHKSSNSKL